MKRPGLLLLLIIAIGCKTTSDRPAVKFSISFTREMSSQAQDGRLLLILAGNDKSEPRNQVNDGLNAQLVFGVDVEGMKPGDEIVIDDNAFGFPIRSISSIPKGQYF